MFIKNYLLKIRKLFVSWINVAILQKENRELWMNNWLKSFIIAFLSCEPTPFLKKVHHLFTMYINMFGLIIQHKQITDFCKDHYNLCDCSHYRDHQQHNHHHYICFKYFLLNIYFFLQINFLLKMIYIYNFQKNYENNFLKFCIKVFFLQGYVTEYWKEVQI